MHDSNEQIDLEKYRLPKKQIDLEKYRINGTRSDKWICARNHPSFINFLKWLSYEHLFDAHQIIKVVEKPYNWQDEFNAFVDVRDIEI